MLDLCPKWLSQVSISILAQAYLHRAGGAPSPRHDFAAISLARFDWFAATASRKTSLTSRQGCPPRSIMISGCCLRRGLV